MPIIVREEAPAKLNLALHVTGLRDDGFHLLDMLVVFTAFGDAIECTHSDEDVLLVVGPMSGGVPTDKRNIVLKTRDYVRTLYPDHDCPPVSITLHKNLPSASGIGGGSADGAATLRALLKLWRLPSDRLAMNALAHEIGADIPMCYYAQPLIARGIGEAIDLIAPPFPELNLVLINCGVEISTPAIFRRLTDKNNAGLPALTEFTSVEALTHYLKLTRNDLAPPAMALCDGVAQSLDALERHGARFSRMSGSGATCFGVFDSCLDAENAAKNIQRLHPDWWVVATQTQSDNKSLERS